MSREVRLSSSGGQKKRILFLADRNVLVDDPKDKTFTPVGEARFKIEGGVMRKSRQMHFAIYQAIAKYKPVENRKHDDLRFRPAPDGTDGTVRPNSGSKPDLHPRPSASSGAQILGAHQHEDRTRDKASLRPHHLG